MSIATFILSHATVIAVLALDQFCKFSVTGEAYTKDFFSILSIKQIWNQGISFGMFDKLPYANSLFLVISSVILSHLYPFLLRIKESSASIAWSLILGGAISNMIDRVVHGAVLDFIDLHYARYQFPVFNIADAAITSGVAVLIWRALMSIRKGR